MRIESLFRLPALVYFLAAASFAANASKEGVLSVSAFQFSSAGIGNSGIVVVAGEQTIERFSSLTAAAFGRRVELSRPQLAKLKVGLINGVQLSYAAGYKETGGRTVYIVLSKGFTSGIKESQVVSVNERGTVEVRDIELAAQ